MSLIKDRKTVETKIVSAIYTVTALLYLYFAFFGVSSDMTHRALLIALLCPTVLILKHEKIKDKENIFLVILDYILAIALFASAIYNESWCYTSE